jgi:hypothetical protein
MLTGSFSFKRKTFQFKLEIYSYSFEDFLNLKHKNFHLEILSLPDSFFGKEFSLKTHTIEKVPFIVFDSENKVIVPHPYLIFGLNPSMNYTEYPATVGYHESEYLVRNITESVPREYYEYQGCKRKLIKSINDYFAKTFTMEEGFGMNENITDTIIDICRSNVAFFITTNGLASGETYAVRNKFSDLKINTGA